MNSTTPIEIEVRELDCASEEAILRRVLTSVRGVATLQFDVMRRRVLITHTGVESSELIRAIAGAGMTPRLLSPTAADTGDGSAATPGDAASPDDHTGAATPAQLVMLGVSGVLALGSEVVEWTMGEDKDWIVIAMSVASIALGGWPTLRKGFFALKSLTLNINFLMSVAVIGACAIGEWPEAAVVVFLFALAELIEAYSLDRARNAVRALMRLAPEIASVRDESGTWADAPVDTVAAGSMVRVLPGERLALDGVVAQGSSAIDQSPITGESMPVDKSPGDQVFAGTINGNGLLEYRTTGGKDQTTLARIIRTVQDAQGQRAPTQRFVDRFARVYTPIVFALAVVIAIGPPLLLAQPWMAWVYKALVLLVIACPCALVIATPVTIVTGLAAAAKRGILIKGGVHLEQGRFIKILAMDKTGTITAGRPALTDVVPIGTTGRDAVLQLAASLDAGSSHPIARAVTSAWTGALLPVEASAALPGRGMSGVVNGGEHFLGNDRLVSERGASTPEVQAAFAALEAQGKTAFALGTAGRVLGVLAVADSPRETSAEAIRSLHQLGVRTMILSGDNQRTAEAIARSVGIDDARGGLLPEEKLVAIDELLAAHGPASVGMVGDGVNDAPALAKASIGFAMGAAGTDTAIETADVALMHDDLRGLPEFLTLSRRAAAILKQNIAIALIAKGAFFVLAILGIASLWMAVLADVGATMVVIANGLRVMRWPRPLPVEASGQSF